MPGHRAPRTTAGFVLAVALLLPLTAGAADAAPPPPASIDERSHPTPRAAASDAVSLAPARFLETRPGLSTVDGLTNGVGLLAAGAVVEVPIAGRGDVPADGVDAAIVNVAAVTPTTDGHLRIYPCDTLPDASTVNYTAGATVANEVVVKLSSRGSICVYAHQPTHVIADATGYLPAASAATSLSPARFLETRAGLSTVDGQANGVGPLAAGAIVEVPIAGRGDVPALDSPGGVDAVIVNVAAVSPQSDGHLRIYPCDRLPDASTINFTTGTNIANEVITKLSPRGSICIYAHQPTHVIADATGYIASDSTVVSQSPQRFLETRGGLSTVDGETNGGGLIGAGETVELPILGRGATGRAPVPSGGVDAAIVNVAAVDPQADGHLRIYPCDRLPDASTINFTTGTNIANEVITKLSPRGTICIYAHQPTHVIADLTGYVRAPLAQPLPDPDPDPDPDPGPDPDPQPGAPFERRYEPGWHVEPAEVVFDADGQSETLELVHYGPDGTRSGRAVPAGTSLIRSQPVFDVTDNGDGSIDVAGNDDVGAEMVGIDIPGEEVVSFWVTSFRFQPGVRMVTPDELAFPSPDGSDLLNTGPFTLAELEQRTSGDPDADTFHYPYVLIGDPPAIGQLLAGDDIYGKVIEPTGAPTIVRDGYSLITLEVVPVGEVFDEFSADVDYARLIDDGVFVPAPIPVACYGFAPGENQLCLEDSRDPDLFPTAAAAAVEVESRAGQSRPITPLHDTSCEPSASVKLGELKIQIVHNLDSKGGFSTTKTPAGDLATVRLTGGFTAKPEVTISGKLQLSGGGSLCIPITPPKAVEVPAFPGPLGALITGKVDVSIVAVGEVAVTGGPAVTFEKKCSVPSSAEFGFVYDVATGQPSLVEDVSPPNPTCPDTKWETTGGTSGLFPPAEGEVKLGAFVRIDAGFRIGGKVAQVIGFLVQEDNLGFVAPFEAAAGPRLDISLENGANVVNSKQPKTGIVLKAVATAAIGIDAVQTFFKQILGTEAIQFPTFQAEFEAALGSILTPPGPPRPVSYRVDGDATIAPQGPTVASGEELEIRLPSPFRPTLLGANFGDLGSLEVIDFTGSPAVSDLFDFTVGGGAATATYEMTPERCQNEHQERRNFGVLGYFEVGGVPAIPAWVGDFALICEQTLSYEQSVSGSSPPRTEEAAVELDAGTPSARVTMRQSGYDGLDWELIDVGANGAPFVTIEPANGTFSAETVDLIVSLDCGDDEETAESTFYQARVDGELTSAQLAVTYDCSPEYFDVRVRETRPGIDVWVASEGRTDDQWVAVGNGSDTLFPDTEALPGGERYENLIRVIDPRPQPTCGDPDSYRSQVRNVTFITNERGEDELRIILPERQPPGGDEEDDNNVDSDDCDDDDDRGPGPPDEDDEDPPGEPTGPGGPSGDPHMTSLDGLRYDAQVLGEYLYSLSDDGNLRLVGRHERSSDGPTQAFGATSMTATSLTVGDRHVEVYANGTGGELRVDGQVVELPYDLEADAGQGIAVTRRRGSFGGDVFAINAPGIILELQARPGGGIIPHLNMDLYTYPSRIALGGLLGSNDGDPSNDLLNAQTLETYLLSDIRRHDTELYEFTDSWRLTDPADSPFTIASPVFDDPNEPRPSSAALAPFRQQVLDQFGALNAVCSGDFAGASYSVDVLAIELAIGNQLSELAEYTCEYVVKGRVTTDVDDQTGGGTVIGVHNAPVTVDAVGLQPCTTTTRPTGDYTCSLVPDLAEIGDGTAISFPLAFDVDVASPGGDSPVASTVGEFTTPSAFDGARISRDNDVTLRSTDVTIVDLAGTLTAFGQPATEETRFELSFLDSSGSELVARQRAIEPDDTGAYRAPFAISEDVDEVVVNWPRGQQGDPDPTTTLDAFTIGVNGRTFDASYDPPLVQVTGTALVNGVAPEQVLITIDAELGDGTTVARQVADQPDADTGAYGAARALPLDSVRADVTVEIDDSDLTPFTGTIDPVVAGPNPLAADLLIDAPVLEVTGTMTVNGAPVVDTTEFEIVATRPGGSTTTTVPVDPAGDGTYGFSVQLPDDATDATITAPIAPNAVDHPTTTVVAPAVGTTAVPFDPTVEFPLLVVMGDISASGQPFTEEVTFRATATSPQAFDRTVAVTPSDDGSYAFSLALPSDTAAAELVAEVGFDAGDHVTLPLSGLTAGNNAVSLSPAFDATVVDIDGTMSRAGTPATGLQALDVRVLDGSGDLLEQRTLFGFADAAGAFTTTIFLPPNTSSIELASKLSAFDEGRAWQRIDGLAPGLNQATPTLDSNPPILDVSGSFTSQGTDVIGLIDIGVDADYFDADGQPASLQFTDTVFASIVDGSYARSIELPETATDVDLSALIGPDPGFHPTLAVPGLAPGSNPVDLSADVVIPVDIQLSVTLTVDGQPYPEPTKLRYRTFDGDDAPVDPQTTIDIDPDVQGTAVETFELSPAVERVDIAWLGTDGPTFQSFAVTSGPNSIGFVETSDWVDVELTGSLTDGGAPFTAATQIEVEAFDDEGDRVGNRFTIDVTPDGAGAYDDALRLAPDVRTLELFWVEQLTGGPTALDVAPGVNQRTFDAEVGTPGPQRIIVRGAITIQGEPWPEDGAFNFRLTRQGGSSFGQTELVTPDPVDGGYELIIEPSQTIVAVRVNPPLGGQTTVLDPIAPAGDTIIDLDIEVPGRLLNVSGTVLDGAVPATEARFGVFDATQPDARYERSVTLDGNGSFAFSQLIDGDPTEVQVGLSNATFDTEIFELVYDDDFVFEAPVPITSGITDIVLNQTFDPPTIDLGGTITQDGAPRTGPFDVMITWFDDDPLPTSNPRTQWTSTETATPDGTGAYSISAPGPRRADRATAVADLGAPLAARKVTIDPLQPGSNPATLSPTFDVSTIEIGGAVTDLGIDMSRDFLVSIEGFDASDDPIGSFTRTVTPSPAGTYAVSFDVPLDTTRIEAAADLTPYDFDLTEPDPAVVFDRTISSIVVDGTTPVTWDLATTGVEISGTAETSDGDPRDGDDFGYLIRSFSGGTGGTPLGEATGSGFTFSGQYDTLRAYLPPGTDTIEFVPSFAGVAPVVLGGISPGPNVRTADIVTDPFRTVNITGTLAVDGATPDPVPQIDLAGYSIVTGTDPELVQRFRELRTDVVFFDGDGTVGGSWEVPPEVDLFEFEVSVIEIVPTGVEVTRYVRWFDLRTSPLDVTIDIDHATDRITVRGVAEVDGTCAHTGERFWFNATILGYDGEPGAPGTSPPVTLFDQFVLPAESPSTDSNGVRSNFDLAAPVPAGITHITVTYTTSGVPIPQTAVLDVTRDAVEFTGGAVNLLDDPLASCPP